MPPADGLAPAGSQASRTKARLAGAFYLGTIACGLFAEIVVRSSVIVRGDGGATAANIARHEALYRAGEAADILMLCCYVAVTTLLYEIFARPSRQLALMATAFSLTGITVLAGNALLHMAPLALLDGGANPALPIAERDALIGLSLRLHGTLYGISLIFFGIYCVLIGLLAIRTAAVPRIVGGLMMVGGSCHIITKFAAILSPDLAHRLPALMNMAPLLGETALALWLILFGVRQRPSSA